MKYPANIPEEELKIHIAKDFFGKFDIKILGRVDFAVKAKIGDKFLIWAEAKLAPTDVAVMLAQLVLTIGKERTFDTHNPPYFLGVFDREKIAFIPYDSVQSIFYQTDFNWNVAPSNHKTREFGIVRELVQQALKENRYEYNFETKEKEIKYFIANNIVKATEEIKRAIDINNILRIYQHWLREIKPLIVLDWNKVKEKQGILDRDFYLADLFVDDRGTVETDDDVSIKNELLVVFKRDHYEIAKEDLRQLYDATISIKNLEAYKQFWKIYKRPPIKKYWQEILDRQDRLVPQDVRERKGAFFTPKKWVDLSQDYIESVLGEDWQREYYVWDCCAGTGNLLANLWNRDNIWASTLDQADVNVMKDQIRNGMNLWESQVFQFDFLNDEFLPQSKGGKLPDGLYDIINDEDKRKKLVIYINPPYAEAMNKRNSKNAKTDVNRSLIEERYSNYIGKSVREVFALFLIRIYCEIPSCMLANFSTLKNLQAPNFSDFRKIFQAKLVEIFLVPAYTFENVKGKFPIGFFIWDTKIEEAFKHIVANMYDKNNNFIGTKGIYSNDNTKKINDWLKQYVNKNTKNEIGAMCCIGNDFQHNNYVNIDHKSQLKGIGNAKGIAKFGIYAENLIPASIYFSVRKVIAADEYNDRDQFLYPNDGWKADTEFQNDCLAYTLFNNNIQSAYGTNNWIPFTETEVNARDRFESRFMTEFIEGGKRGTQMTDLFSADTPLPQEKPARLEFSTEATAVFDAGRELWRYYHAQTGGESNVNASLYDIRANFQGRNDKGKMNNKSTDERYNELISALRSALKTLARKIEPKVYEYGFLKT